MINIILAIMLVGVAQASDGKIVWLTGAELERVARELPVSADWSQAPLGSQTRAFSRAQRVAIFLDRRVDPNQLLDVHAANVTLEQFLWTIAADRQLGVCQIGDVFYIGPRPIAAAIPSLFEQLDAQVNSREISRELRGKLTHLVAIDSHDPFEPGELLIGLADAAEITLENPEMLPMDFWHPLQLPAMQRWQAFALMLVGFDRSFTLTQDGIRFCEMRMPDQVTRVFPVPANSNKLDDEIRNSFVGVQVKSTRDKITVKITVTASPETASQIEQMLVSRQRPRLLAGAQKRFTLKTNAPRGNILASIAKQMAWKFEIAEGLHTMLSERVEIDVHDATIEALITATLEGCNIEFKIADNSLRLSAKK